jgi:hypothetical protein
MVKPEQAREELLKVRLPDGEKRRLAALAKLPPKLATVGRGLLGRDPRGRSIRNAKGRNRAKADARLVFEALSPGERRRLFEAFFPGMAPHFEAAWEMSYQLPYENRYERQSFRAPHDPELTREGRFRRLVRWLGVLEGYEQDITWLAAWVGHLGWGDGAGDLGLPLAAAINAGGREGDAVFDILCRSARGDHPVGVMGRHVIQALLTASRPDGWELVGQLLLDALRREDASSQGIFETMNEADPGAFCRMLRLIREHDLARFEEAVWALNTWFGFQWGAVSTRVAGRVLERVVTFLKDSSAQARALESDDSETVYLALWTLAFADTPATVEPAAALLTDPNVERRFVAVHLLAQLEIPSARAKLLAALDDADLRVALHALEACEEDDLAPRPRRDEDDLFDRLERLLARLPQEPKFLEPIVWPWHVFRADRSTIAASLFRHVDQRPPTVLIRHLPAMESWSRREVADRLARMRKWDEPTRAALFTLVGDKSMTVRESAFRALARCVVRQAEAVRLEELLSRKAADLRRGVLTLLLKQKDRAVLASADRLLAAGRQLQRQAGLELLGKMAEAGRSREECRARLEGLMGAGARF